MVETIPLAGSQAGETLAATELPTVRDASGYVVSESDLEFLRISDESVVAWASRQVPLGMTPLNYADVVRRLVHALERECLEGRSALDDADVRLQGSSAHFFSNRSKPMCFTREAIASEFMSHGLSPSMPTIGQIDGVLTQLETQWPCDHPRPAYRPFDVMFRVGVHVAPSDYDFQVSSSLLVNIIRAEIGFESVDPDMFDYTNSTYSFVKKNLVVQYLRYLWAWSEIATSIVGRPVNLALFDSSGPPRVEPNSDDPEPLSSHFQDTDWVIAVRSGT